MINKSEVKLSDSMGVIEIIKNTNETTENHEKDAIINLDNIIDFNETQKKEGGKKSEKNPKKERLQEEILDQKENLKSNQKGIDIDNLLDNISIT